MRAEIEESLVRARGCACTCVCGSLSGRGVLGEVADGGSVSLWLRGLHLEEGAPAAVEFVHGATRYRFRSTVVRVRLGETILAFPTALEQINLRSTFRVGAALGTSVRFRWEGRDVEAELINFSAGGAAFSAEPLGAAVGERLTYFQLSLPGCDGPQEVTVVAALIRRVAPLPGGRARYGVSFEQVDRQTEERLFALVRRRELQLARAAQERA